MRTHHPAAQNVHQENVAAVKHTRKFQEDGQQIVLTVFARLICGFREFAEIADAILLAPLLPFAFKELSRKLPQITLTRSRESCPYSVLGMTRREIIRFSHSLTYASGENEKARRDHFMRSHPYASPHEYLHKTERSEGNYSRP